MSVLNRVAGGVVGAIPGLSGVGNSISQANDLTPGFSLTNVAKTQLANAEGKQVPGLNTTQAQMDAAQAGHVPGASTTTPNNQPAPSGTYDPNAAALASQNNQTLAQNNTLADQLRQQLGQTDGSLQQGMDSINSDYNQQASAANTQRSRALQDFQTKQQDTNQGYQQALDQVNTKARTLANSVRQMIGNASGSGSSAYQITAPGAVQRQANTQNEAINNDYGQNFSALSTAKTRADQDFGTFLDNLSQTRDKSLGSLRSQIGNTKDTINGQLAGIAAQNAALQGGNYKTAAAPYQANISNEDAAVKAALAQYAHPFTSITPVTVAAPTLRDYVTGQTAVGTADGTAPAATTATYNPLATWNKQDDTQNQLY